MGEQYFLGHSPAETRRLMAQAKLLAPITRAILVAAGVGPGMRVLDVGTGMGDVALLAAELVGTVASGPTTPMRARLGGQDLVHDPQALAHRRDRRALDDGDLGLVEVGDVAQHEQALKPEQMMKALAPEPGMMPQAQASLAASSCKVQTEPTPARR